MKVLKQIYTTTKLREGVQVDLQLGGKAGDLPGSFINWDKLWCIDNSILAGGVQMPLLWQLVNQESYKTVLGELEKVECGEVQIFFPEKSLVGIPCLAKVA